MSNRINVTRSLMPPIEEYIEEIRPMWESHWLTNMGMKHEELELALLKYLQIPYISLMSNGHMSLELALQAMELKGEVITTPFTFASTTHAIVRNNLTPVFCDIKADDFTIDTEQIESLITEQTTAILPVHVYGNICDVDAIQKIADRYGLKVIYDAAHAFGETYHGIGVGNFGDASIFSFHATKIFNTIEGGAVCYHDEDYGLKLYRLKNFGIRNEEVVDGVGANAKMNEFEAAMGLCNLRYVENEMKERKRVAEYYRERLDGVNGIRLNMPNIDFVSNYAYFPIVVDPARYGATRDELQLRLKQENIYTRKYFYPITSAFDCYKNQYDPRLTPIAYEISHQVLTLPIYGDLQETELDLICNTIRRGI